jgi:hypothetical protein
VVARDEDGVDLPDTDAAHREAIGSLSDAIRGHRDPGVREQQINVEVRDGLGAIFEVSATVRSKILSGQQPAYLGGCNPAELIHSSRWTATSACRARRNRSSRQGTKNVHLTGMEEDVC